MTPEQAIRILDNETSLVAVEELKRTNTETKGITRYIGIKVKPKLKVGQKVSAGDEI